MSSVQSVPWQHSYDMSEDLADSESESELSVILINLDSLEGPKWV